MSKDVLTPDKYVLWEIYRHTISVNNNRIKFREEDILTGTLVRPKRCSGLERLALPLCYFTKISTRYTMHISYPPFSHVVLFWQRAYLVFVKEKSYVS